MTVEPVAALAVAAPPATELRPRTWRLRPAVLVLAAVVAAAAPVQLGVTPYAVMAAGALAVLVVLSKIDLQARILPNKILLPATGACSLARSSSIPSGRTRWLRPRSWRAL